MPRRVTTLYFDTNVYYMIRKSGELQAVQEFLRRGRFRVLASCQNLFEVLPVSCPHERSEELRVLTTLASRFERFPQSYLQAREVRDEIRRCRPDWLGPSPDKRAIHGFLREHRDRWARAVAEKIVFNETWDQYSRDSADGIRRSRGFQKTQRALLSQGADELHLLALGPAGEVEAHGTVSLLDPETFRRTDCLMVWHNALVNRVPASRDYADWLGPYLREGAFGDPTYRDFWMVDASGEAMLRNLASSLTSPAAPPSAGPFRGHCPRSLRLAGWRWGLALER